MKTLRNKIITLVAMLFIAVSVAVAAPGVSSASADNQRLVKQVRHELLTLPYYGVFDNLAYKVEGNTVTLYGQVVRSSTRTDAERRVRRLPGVAQVVNQIELLPLSGFDDQIRVRAYRTVFRTGGLYRYAMGSNPSLHIVVNNGHLTLEGVVGSRMDRQLAYMAANSVPGVFSVTNNLQVEGESLAR